MQNNILLTTEIDGVVVSQTEMVNVEANVWVPVGQESFWADLCADVEGYKKVQNN